MDFIGKEKLNRPCKSQQGLSVLELLIVVAAIAIVVLITVPGSTMLLEKYRLKTSSTSLLDGLELAKSEAQLRSSTVKVCPSSNGHSCRKDGNWNYGWVVFSDGNGNGTVQDIELIRAFEAPNQKIRITAQGAVEKMASFNVTGLIGENGVQTGRFEICVRDSDSPPKILTVNAEGWVQLVAVHNESCLAG